MAYRLGVDVGGTFTDLFLVNDEDGTQHRVKTPSTPSDPSQGVLNGVARICETAGITPGDLGNIMHGTTVATNAVLEGKGARVGLITTQGFQQILHLARSQTPGPLAGWIIMQKPEPPATLADTREAVERMGPRGETVVPVDEQTPTAVAIRSHHQTAVVEHRRAAGYELDPGGVVVVRQHGGVTSGWSLADVDTQHHRALLVP